MLGPLGASLTVIELKVGHDAQGASRVGLRQCLFDSFGEPGGLYRECSDAGSQALGGRSPGAIQGEDNRQGTIGAIDDPLDQCQAISRAKEGEHPGGREAPQGSAACSICAAARSGG
jgi:hypothetical protein